MSLTPFHYYTLLWLEFNRCYETPSKIPYAHRHVGSECRTLHQILAEDEAVVNPTLRCLCIATWGSHAISVATLKRCLIS